MFEEWRERQTPISSKQWWKFLSNTFFQQVSNFNGLCLDVGCGSGSYLCHIIEKEGCEGIGLDPSKKSSLNVLKHDIEDETIEKLIELIQGAGEDLPIKNACVQLCIMTGTLDHVKNPHQTLREIHRVLDYNGEFILLQSVVKEKMVSDKSHHMNQFTISELYEMFNQFEIERTKRFFPISSKFHIPERLLNSAKIYKILTRMYSMFARYFQNYSVVIMTMRKRR